MKLKKRTGIENFLKGFGSSINIFPKPIKLEDINPNYSEKYSPAEKDARAIAEDWKKIDQIWEKQLKNLKNNI